MLVISVSEILEKIGKHLLLSHWKTKLVADCYSILHAKNHNFSWRISAYKHLLLNMSKISFKNSFSLTYFPINSIFIWLGSDFIQFKTIQKILNSGIKMEIGYSMAFNYL